MIEFPVLPILRASIDACPSEGLTFIETEWKRPHSTKGLGNYFRDCCDRAGLPHCSAHGLRKAGATIAAENGASESILMAIYGWDDPKMAALYTKAARRRKMARDSMHLLIPNAQVEDDQDIAQKR